MDAEKKPAMHTLTMEGRGCAHVSGVQSVGCFNEREIVLETCEGEIALLGENLHIEQLNLQDGRLDVTGRIDGLEYCDRAPQRVRRGLFSRKKA